MKKVKKKLKNPNTVRYIYRGIIASVILTIYFLTIGYSSSSATATIENLMASVRPQADVRITNVLVSGTTNSGLSDAENYNISNIYGTVELPYANSTVTYKIDVTVFLSSEMMIKSITGLNSNLEYELTDYNIGDVLCNNSGECNYGATKEFYLTIKYKDNCYDSSNTTYPYKLDFLFESNNRIAKIGTRYFDSLQDAINTVPNDTETNVYLLNNTSENVKVEDGQIINLYLQGNIVSNKGNLNVFVNEGTLHMINGSIVTEAGNTQGSINNNSTGTLILENVTILMSGTKQALYNDKGTATIKGNSYLYSGSSNRGAVQNVSPGVLNIQSGKIVSSAYHAVVNGGTLTVGVQGGGVDVTNPEIQGYNQGINTTSNFKFYDGIIKGKSKTLNDNNKANPVESGYALRHSTEVIDGVTYNTTILGEKLTITLNSNGGSGAAASITVFQGEPLTALPTPSRSGYDFLGWYNDQNVLVDTNTIATESMTLTAQWQKIVDVAKIGDTIYDSIQNAVNKAPNNTQTTIEVLRETNERITVNSSKNIILDLGNNTISNSGNSPIIENHGTLEVINGTLSSTANQGAINNKEGHLTVNGITITTTIRQTIYVEGGVTEIKGNAYLTSATSGIPVGGTMERATVQCLANGELIITGGTIISENSHAVSNEGILTIGTKDGSISTTTPVLRGTVYGVKSTGTFNFYDGILKGKEDAYMAIVSDQETSSTITTGTETIGSNVYQTAHLTAN